MKIRPVLLPPKLRIASLPILIGLFLIGFCLATGCGASQSSEKGSGSAIDSLQAGLGSPAAESTTGADRDLYITPEKQSGSVYADFRSFSTVSAYNRHPKTKGFIYDSPEAVGLVKGLYPSALRFPGGSFAAKFKPRAEKGEKLIDAHIALSRKSGAMKTILVLNFKTGSIDDASYLVSRLKKAGIEVIAVELGNEIHLKRYREAIPTVNDFIDVAVEYIDALGPMIPNASFGIPVASSRHVFDAEQFGKRAEYFENWNTTLGDAVKSGRLQVQAVIPHFYKQTHEVYDLPTKQERFDGLVSQLRIDSYDFLDKAVISYYRERFGNVEMWVTEWGVKEKQVYGNTLVEGLHVMGFMLDMVRGNERTGDRFRHSCYQKLAAQPGIGTISPKGKYPTVEPSKDYKPETSWYAFHFLGAFLQGTNYVESEIQGASQNDVRIETFKKGDDFYVAFANRTGDTFRCNIAGEAHFLTGDHPWSSNGQNIWNGEKGYDPVTLVDGQLTNMIPPWSYGYIKASWSQVVE